MGSENKSNVSIKACIKVAACICAKDGVISQAEELSMYKMVVERFPEWNQDMFESTLVEFFDSRDQIEDYLILVESDALKLFSLELAEVSASSDGLETRENIALEKAYIFWGIERDA